MNTPEQNQILDDIADATRPLAERIASALLTPHGGPEGTRLAIKLKRPDGTESDLGGNNKQSIIDTVNKVLGTQERERAELIAALEAVTERAEAVSRGITVDKRSKGVSQATHVAHMASHLAQHCKPARELLTRLQP